MNWLDIDHNGRVDGKDFFILNEIIGLDDEKEKEKKNDLFSDYDEDRSDDNNLW